MSARVRGVGAEAGSVMLIILGIAGYLVEPAQVARLLTFFVIYLGSRDMFTPAPGRTPNLFVLVIGVWAALSAYGIFGFDFLNSWPLLVVLIGISVIVQSFVTPNRARPQGQSQ
jgi:hypothetical protein